MKAVLALRGFLALEGPFLEGEAPSEVESSSSSSSSLTEALAAEGEEEETGEEEDEEVLTSLTGYTSSSSSDAEGDVGMLKPVAEVGGSTGRCIG